MFLTQDAIKMEFHYHIRKCLEILPQINYISVATLILKFLKLIFIFTSSWKCPYARMEALVIKNVEC